jgi:hypothetical protein
MYVLLFQTTELANSDLEKYYKAMDRAIMNYHAQKMAEINTIIRELWRNTYRGNGRKYTLSISAIAAVRWSTKSTFCFQTVLFRFHGLLRIADIRQEAASDRKV